MTLEELVRGKREEILHLCAKHGARSVRVFGSLARGQADEGSDSVRTTFRKSTVRSR